MLCGCEQNSNVRARLRRYALLLCDETALAKNDIEAEKCCHSTRTPPKNLRTSLQVLTLEECSLAMTIRTFPTGPPNI